MYPCAGPNDGIDSLPGKLLDIRDGSLPWGSKGNAVRGNFPNAAAAPATVSGESFVICHWEISVLGRRRTVTTREPGDLPSAVVTREDVGRGVQTFASLRCAKAHW